eukprot:scaffold143528_cov20-Tisochrysis_lutea.AAC.2
MLVSSPGVPLCSEGHASLAGPVRLVSNPGMLLCSAGQASSTGPIMLITSPDKDQFQSVLAEINSSIQGCMQGYLVGLTVKGVGYRLEPIEESVSERMCDLWS